MRTASAKAATANLLVTHDPNHEGMARESVIAAFREIGCEPVFLKPEIEGMFYLFVKEPKDAVTKLQSVVKKKPLLFRTTWHWIPVDCWCSSVVPDMRATVKRLAAGIADSEKWKMSIEKRCYDALHTPELIMKLTEVIDKPNVDLEQPDRIVRVDIIGKNAAISLLATDELLAVPVMQQAAGAKPARKPIAKASAKPAPKKAPNTPQARKARKPAKKLATNVRKIAKKRPVKKVAKAKK